MYMGPLSLLFQCSGSCIVAKNRHSLQLELLTPTPTQVSVEPLVLLPKGLDHLSHTAARDMMQSMLRLLSHLNNTYNSLYMTNNGEDS